MFTIFIAAVAVAVFVMYFRHEHQVRRQRRASDARAGDDSPADREAPRS